MEGHSNRKDADTTELNKNADLIHLSLVYLSEEFKVEADQDNLIKYLQSVFLNEVSNNEFNPYYEYSKQIKEEVDEVMSFEEVFEARGEACGEARGEILGKIDLLLEMNYSGEKIIEYLTSTKNNSLTKKDAEMYIEMYYDKHKNE